MISKVLSRAEAIKTVKCSVLKGDIRYKSVYDAPSTDEQLFAGKVHKIVLFSAQTGECEFVASHQTHKSTISTSARFTETIVTAQYSVVTVGIHYKAVYDVLSTEIRNSFLVLCRFFSPLLVTII